MSRAPLHALIWSKEQRLYELHTQDRLEQRFQPTDEATWQSWLREVTSFAFQRSRLAQCLSGAQATRGSVLVCLPYQPGPHPQALSWTDGDPLAGSFGADGALALARAAASTSVRPGNAGALRQARSAALADRAGGTGALALGARWGTFYSTGPALGPGRLWQNHAAFRLGEPARGAGRLALAG